jgi:hypothetical protein
MIETAVSRAVRDVRREVAPVRRDDDHPQLRIRIAEPTAKIMLLPGRFWGAEYVKRHVEWVLTRPAEQGEQHVRRNLNAIRRVLDEMGVDRDDADREVKSIEANVRAELWRQVLTPDGQP